MILTNEFQHKMLNPAIRVTSLVVLVLAASFFTSCDDDDENGFPSVQGKWVGDKTELFAEIEDESEPWEETNDDFEGKVDFKQNGTALFSDDEEETIGSWLQNTDKLSLVVPMTEEDLVDLSGTYTIKEITKDKLKIHLEKETTIYHPEYGFPVEASIKVTLWFKRQ